MSPLRAPMLVAALLVAVACSDTDEAPSQPAGTAGGGGGTSAEGGGVGGARGGAGGSKAEGGAGAGAGGEGGGDPCANRPPLALTSRFDMIYSNANPTPVTYVGTTDWLDAFGMEFPRETGAAKRLRTERDHYAVITFETFDVAESGGLIDTDNPQIFPETGNKLVSISPCPGDFRPPIDDPNCRRDLGPVSNMRWSFEEGGFSCRLERDRTYYLNVLFTDADELPAAWACTGAPAADICGMRVASAASF